MFINSLFEVCFESFNTYFWNLFIWSFISLTVLKSNLLDATLFDSFLATYIRANIFLSRIPFTQ